MKLAALSSLVLLLAAVGCAAAPDAPGAATDDSDVASAPSADLEALLARGIDAKNLDTFRPATSPMLVMHNPGVFSVTDEVAPDHVATEEFEGLALLRRVLESGVRGQPKKLSAVPRFDCDVESYVDASGKKVPNGHYFAVIQNLTEFSDATIAVGDALDEDGEAQAATQAKAKRLRAIEKRVTHAIFAPELHAVLYFGQESGAWKLFAADIVTPCDA